MRPRDARWLLLVVVAASGCGGGTGYVRTSLDNERHFRRTAPEVRVSDKRRGTVPNTQRELAAVQQHLVKGNFAAARAGATAVLKRDPGSIQGHTFLALALERSGDATGAGAHYRRAAELAPGNGAVLSNYGVWLCAQGQAVESLAWFDRAIALPGYGNGNVSMALANAGVCAAKAGQQERADRDLRRSIELDPENAVALGALAERAFRSGNALQARAFSERRLAAAPADPGALLLASQIEQELGDTAAAARYVARLNAEFPDASEARNSPTGDGGRQ